MKAVMVTGGLDKKWRTDGDEAGIIGHAQCRYGMRRGHVDGWAKEKFWVVYELIV
jgi:hypothetical protein